MDVSISGDPWAPEGTKAPKAEPKAEPKTQAKSQARAKPAPPVQKITPTEEKSDGTTGIPSK